MFTFEPMTEEEIKALNLIDPGVYDFEVVKAEQKTSKSGNPMIEMVLKILDANGRERQITDYLVSMKSMMFKIKHFSDSVGLQDKYAQGTFSERDCVGRSGKVEIAIQKGQPNPNGGMYADKAAVKDYVMTDKGAVKYDSSTGEMQDDAIPF